MSVSISDKQVTPKVGPTSDSSSFVLYTPFDSIDFDDDICDPPSGNPVLIVGLAASQKCKTGEQTLTPITIPLNQVSSSPDCTTFQFMSAALTANWSITVNPPPPPPPPSSNQSQSVSCINGVCTVSGGGTNIITNGNGTTVVQQNNTGNQQTPPTGTFSFNAASTTPGVIAVPASKVDAFILYTADGDADDSGSGYEGACVTLKSFAASTQIKTSNGTRTVTKFFGAH